MAKKSTKKLECEEYDEEGNCVKFKLVNGEMVGFIPEEAKKCNPKAAAKAEKLIRAGKVRIDLR